MLLALTAAKVQGQCWQYVDPRIGSVGVGRTFPGPCMPFGMVKPGPDCGVLPNAGWAPMPAAVTGFSQTHVSGTGGGQKYGNILIQPLLAVERNDVNGGRTEQLRTSEDISLGYYATTFENGIRTEITTAERCAFYRIHYPSGSESPLSSEGARGRLFIDVTHFLGKDTVPDLRERQQFVGGEMEVVGDHEVRGYSRIRGGWNNGDAYTVYFCLLTDKPFLHNHGNILTFTDSVVNIKVGISYVSSLQARKNIPSIGFDEQLTLLRSAWEQQLAKIQIEGTEAQKRMFYTALYHTMLMPVDKTGENPKWTEHPYYDDYYAIWDTYRTSSPLITLLAPERQTAIINSLLNIYKREGYMPDARSGDCNGRTQGGSNAEVMIADAYVKGLDGIDYHLALEAMLKDAETDPGADHEKHGRGGLNEYKQLGYIPYGIDRAGTRTVEYAFDDYCIAQVAKGLGKTTLYNRYMKRSENWKNLWRSDYEWDGVRGYIMPRDANGCWLDSVPWGARAINDGQLTINSGRYLIPYTPVTKVAPWYLPWWSTFFYEALSAEYSLSIPHDVPGLIEACGGTDAFRKRLDLFFERQRYNVGNEPSFLTPCLYHWIGRPDLSSQRIHQIVTDNYSDAPDGLPGNDDSGAMSSWLAFHMMGLYPNAGHSYYLLNVPLIPEWTFTLSNGQTMHGIIKGKGTHFERVTLNGKVLKDARLEHADLMQGGELVFYVSSKSLQPAKSQFATEKLPVSNRQTPSLLSDNYPEMHRYDIAFTLNRQFRTWPFGFRWEGDTLLLRCKEALYKIPRSEVDGSDHFCWENAQKDGAVYDRTDGTFCFVSRRALRQLLEQHSMNYEGVIWHVVDETDAAVHVRAAERETEMWVSKTAPLPLVLEMRHNPLGIDWKITLYEKE